MPTKKRIPFTPSLALLVSGLALAASLQAQTTSSQPPAMAGNAALATAVVATVGGKPITLAEVNFAAGEALKGVTDPQQILRIRTAALEGIILQRAMLARIEREKFLEKPDVARAYEEIKKEALINFYISKMLADESAASPKDLKEVVRAGAGVAIDHQSLALGLGPVPRSDDREDPPKLQAATNRQMAMLTWFFGAAMLAPATVSLLLQRRRKKVSTSRSIQEVRWIEALNSREARVMVSVAALLLMLFPPLQLLIEQPAWLDLRAGLLAAVIAAVAAGPAAFALLKLESVKNLTKSHPLAPTAMLAGAQVLVLMLT
jgi:hypothetical protein